MSKVRVAATRCARSAGGKRLDKDVIAHKGVRMFRQLAVATAAALVLTGLTAAPSVASPPPPDGDDRLVGLHRHRRCRRTRGHRRPRRRPPRASSSTPTAEGLGEVERRGHPERRAGRAARRGRARRSSRRRRRRSAASLQAGDGVFRPYSGAGGLQEELIAQAAAHPTIAELEVIGQTVHGQDIVAVRVTEERRRRRRTASGPTTVYVGAQHAREWITPEMVRRLLDHVLDGYGTDHAITDLVDTTELWFIPVANPDGYDFTFEDGQPAVAQEPARQRRRRRDHAGSTASTSTATTPTRWGYDNEGSSPNPASDTYRGTGAGLRARDAGARRAVRADHARVLRQLPLGRRAAAARHRLAGRDAVARRRDLRGDGRRRRRTRPIPGYDPDISAELYTTNGDIDSHMQEAYGTLGFTPEMSTCEAASDRRPRRRSG